MKTTEYKEQLNQDSPKIIYLYGTTAVGKSTFAQKLAEEFSYKIVDLDQMIKDEIVNKFGLEEGDTFKRVNRGEGAPEWIEHYLKKVHLVIGEAGDKVVIECPIKHAPTVHKILDPYEGSYDFLFLFPSDKDIYIERLTKRILRHKDGNFGLPKTFWATIPEDAKESFFKNFEITKTIERAIEAYSDKQISRSRTFLEELKKTFEIKILDI